MTKEECIGKNPIIADKGGNNLYVKRSDALKSMDEWAKAYGVWLGKQNMSLLMKHKNEELYELFLKSNGT